MQYLRLTAPDDLPATAASAPYKCVFISETDTDREARETVADWLVASGCLYFMAWGSQAREWHEAVNLANLRAFDFAPIPDDRLIICTDHINEERREVFWFCKNTAMHPCAELATLILHRVSNDIVVGTATPTMLQEEFESA